MRLEHKKLSEEDDLSPFDCSKDDEMGLNEFIHEEALHYQNERLGITYLFRYDECIVSFVTVSMGDIRAEEVEEKDKMEQNIRTYPALYIGRLAVNNDHRGKDIGKYCCKWCIGLALDLSETLGCRYVTLHTVKKWIPFYGQCGFTLAKIKVSGKRHISCILS